MLSKQHGYMITTIRYQCADASLTDHFVDDGVDEREEVVHVFTEAVEVDTQETHQHVFIQYSA